jgi:hypothetical protein
VLFSILLDGNDVIVVIPNDIMYQSVQVYGAATPQTESINQIHRPLPLRYLRCCWIVLLSLLLDRYYGSYISRPEESGSSE